MKPFPDSKSPEYRTWCRMRERCYSPSSFGYKFYRAKGIEVCDRWKDSFANFYADMGNRPSPEHTLDRIDSTGNYELENCRWATRQEQANNRSNNRIVVYKGASMSLAEAVRAAGDKCSQAAAWQRLERGWDVDRAIETPLFKKSRKALSERVREALVQAKDRLEQVENYKYGKANLLPETKAAIELIDSVLSTGRV